MLPVNVRRVLMAEHRVDFRKSFDGLLAEAFRVGAQPYEGDCMIFVKKDRTQIRALIGDSVRIFLGLHQRYLIAEGNLKKSFDAALGELRRALHIIRRVRNGGRAARHSPIFLEMNPARRRASRR